MPVAVDHERVADLADRRREDRRLPSPRSSWPLPIQPMSPPLGGLGVVGVVARGVGERQRAVVDLRLERCRPLEVGRAVHDLDDVPAELGLDRVEELAGLRGPARRSRPRTPRRSRPRRREVAAACRRSCAAALLVALRARDRVEQARVGLELGVGGVGVGLRPPPRPGRSRRTSAAASGSSVGRVQDVADLDRAFERLARRLPAMKISETSRCGPGARYCARIASLSFGRGHVAAERPRGSRRGRCPRCSTWPRASRPTTGATISRDPADAEDAVGALDDLGGRVLPRPRTAPRRTAASSAAFSSMNPGRRPARSVASVETLLGDPPRTPCRP